MLCERDGVVVLAGPRGQIQFPEEDILTRRIAMLYEGECEGLGGSKAAAKYGVSRPRYYQLLHAFKAGGACALINEKRGPKKHSRRTDELTRQVIRHRFLDPDASVEVIGQKLRQCGFTISDRSVWRVIEELGLQKKTLHVQPATNTAREDRDSPDP